MNALSHRVETLLGTAVVATAPVAGGDICTATRVRLSDGRTALVKTRPGAPAGFFPTEAEGLRWLAQTGGVPVPEVLAAEPDCLILTWVETGRPSPEAAEAFGRGLARTHAAGAPCFGTASGNDGWIGLLPLPNRSAPGWPEFYATRRVLPYLKLARDRGRIDPADARSVETVVRRINDLAGPAEPPARLHGDLWSGNLLWGVDGAVHLVDPAAHGGHRETDLAMLALFGCPQLPRVLETYHESTPLAYGWEDRVPLHHLYPLLVHACLFGGGYGARAGDAARSLL
ncbi:fructosamine kinase family protein [Nocardioides mesophilus]|uniref:Fructosamine kinase family protein n=1 Tax=Nocardioides mesophilus TaxID=433659 RepID=A0A7G9RFB6_9ACTN|nr:fructosamine kinase family protein [Nocardioides mesophilus]